MEENSDNKVKNEFRLKTKLRQILESNMEEPVHLDCRETLEGLTRTLETGGPFRTKETTQRRPMIGHSSTLVELFDYSEQTGQVPSDYH